MWKQDNLKVQSTSFLWYYLDYNLYYNKVTYVPGAEVRVVVVVTWALFRTVHSVSWHRSLMVLTPVAAVAGSAPDMYYHGFPLGCSISINFGQSWMYTLFMFAIAFGPPIDWRSRQLKIFKFCSDLRLLLQRSPGMNTIPWQYSIDSDSREVRFFRQHLGDQAEKLPHLHNKSVWRDGGNTIPLSQ